MHSLQHSLQHSLLAPSGDAAGPRLVPPALSMLPLLGMSSLRSAMLVDVGLAPPHA